MPKTQDSFHTKHDLTPEFAYAVFQLLTQVDSQGITPNDLLTIAQQLGSPLAKRSNLTKILRGMEELELVQRRRELVSLSAIGQALAASVGSYERGFLSAIHCLYFWTWLWQHNEQIATPSWSYWQVCREIQSAGINGINRDEIVLRIVNNATAQFQCEKVSFSRSSIHGVTIWLEAQTPALIDLKEERIFPQTSQTATSAELLRLNIGALYKYLGGPIPLSEPSLLRLAESLLITIDSWIDSIVDFVSESSEFILTSGVKPKIVLKNSDDAFLHWMTHN